MLRSITVALCGAAVLLSQPFTAAAQNSTNTTSKYPVYIADGSSSPPWGQATVENTNPYKTTPDTGKVRSYDFTITRGTVAPDGTKRSTLLINGQYPGPLIEANWGDTIQVTVHNEISGPPEGTSMHWHGILQTGTPYEDGTPGVAQCPIPPGQSYTYSFRADLYGTTFYHSHFSAQFADGIVGPLVIYGPYSQSYDADLGPVMLTDWSHDTYETQVKQAVGAGGTGLVFSVTSLINGVTDGNFSVNSGSSYRMRLVNIAAEAPYTFSIDEHEFSVIAHDFVPVQPYTATSITLGVGQRADIVFNATGDPSKTYWVRSAPNSCSLVQNKSPAKAILWYQDASATQTPDSTAQDYSTGCGFNELSSDNTPSYQLSPPSSPATTVIMNITNWTNETGSPVWGINNVSFHANYDDPPLLLSHNQELLYPYNTTWSIFNMGSNDSVRLVVYNFNDQSSHPMHLHGHNFWIVAEGFGQWNGQTSGGSNPPRRDTFMLNAAQSSTTPAYTVIEYNQDNPGVWPFHCHIAWHVSGGLYANMLERPADIVSLSIPAKLNDGCGTYKSWQSAGNIVNQIDSGLR